MDFHYFFLFKKKGWNFLKWHQILLKITKKLNGLGRELGVDR